MPNDIVDTVSQRLSELLEPLMERAARTGQPDAVSVTIELEPLDANACAVTLMPNVQHGGMPTTFVIHSERAAA